METDQNTFANIGEARIIRYDLELEIDFEEEVFIIIYFYLYFFYLYIKKNIEIIRICCYWSWKFKRIEIISFRCLEIKN